MKKLLFTDLDGTLLDLHTYSANQVRGAVKKLKEKGVSIIFCSSKTWAEQEYYLKQLNLKEPVIVENGSGIFLQDSDLDISLEMETIRGRKAIVLGRIYIEIVGAIEKSANKVGAVFKYYNNQTLEEIAKITGLSEEGASKARTRDFSETLFDADKSSEIYQLFKRDIESNGYLCMPGSKFVTITGGGCDKGKAVRLLIDAYRQHDPDVTSFGVGDSRNDQEMLATVDHPFLVQKPDKRWADLDVPGLKKVAGVGPQGWNIMAEEILGGR